jgi:selenoprotein W-related protein
MAGLTKKYEYQISEITLVPSDGGKFEVSVDGNLVYSKLRTGRHANPGEVEKLVGEAI